MAVSKGICQEQGQHEQRHRVAIGVVRGLYPAGNEAPSQSESGS